MGIGLFIIGIAATIINMTMVTEQGLVQNAITVFQQYGLGDYHRPAELQQLGWVGVIAHPLNYAFWLYLAITRWQKGKLASWCAIVGAVCAFLISLALLTTALLLHPEILAFVQSGGVTPTPTPTP